MAGKEGGSIDVHQKLTDAYFANDDVYINMARESGVSLTELLESRIPPKERSRLGASVVEVMMWHRNKVDLIGRGYSNSSPVNKVGDFTNETFNKSVDAKFFWEFNEDQYCRTLQTGASPEELASISPDTRNPGETDRLSSLAGLAENTAENQWDEQPMILSKQWQPQIDYRRIVSRVQNTSRRTVRIPYNTTEEDPNEMDVTPEGVAPLVVELGYSRETLNFTGYGATLIATDDYLLDNQTTAEAIREEVMKLGMRRREALFHSLIRLAVEKCQSSNVIDFGSGIKENDWQQFRKKYENYAMNTMLGSDLSISQWETMYFGVGQNRQVTMDFFARRGTGSNPTQLNNQPAIPDYGWITREKTYFNSESSVNIGGVNIGPSRQFLITFDKRHTLRVWFRRGLSQDEMQRVPDERKMKRHLHTDVGYVCPDFHSIWCVHWG